jgi:hypothetical protein
MNKELTTSNAVQRGYSMGRLYATGALLTVVAAASFAAPKAAPTPSAAPVEVVPPPQSVFVDRPDFGRDPFFPKSPRRRGAVTPTNSVVEPVANFGNLALKGISVSNEKRMAIINNKTFEVDEEAEVPVNGQRVRVKVTEIRDKSVVITVNGVSKELFLGKL